jgi:membrane protease YdiL (CAAX protease family)
LNHIYKFFSLTFLFSWLLWLPGVLITHNLLPASKSLLTISNNLNWIAGIGPTFAAVLLVLIYQGKSGLKVLLKRILQFKIGIWYFPAVLLLPLVIIAAHLINTLFFNASLPETGLIREPLWIPVVFIVFFILQFGEEFGWRGYALDNLQSRMNALNSSIILGSIWAIWHIPMFLSSGFGHYDYHLPFAQFFITFVLISILMTWIQNNTRNSLLPAFIIHTQINLSGEVLPLIEKNTEVQGDYTPWIIVNFILFIIVLFVCAFWGYKRLIRER